MATPELKTRKTAELLSESNYPVIDPTYQCTTDSAKGEATHSTYKAA